MTNFNDEFQTDALPDIDEMWGTSAVRTSPDAATETVTGRWSPGEVLPGYFPDGKQEIESGVWRVNPANLATWSMEDTWKIDGKTFAVIRLGSTEPVLEFQLERRTEVRTGGDEHFVKRT